MFKKLNSIRMTYVRSHLYALLLILVTLISISLSIYVLFEPEWLNISAIFLFFSLYIIIGLMVSVYAGFKSSSRMKERIDYLSLLITQYANGNYQSRIHLTDTDEITRIGNELNELGAKLQNQVKSLQRMADEKTEFAKSAHKAATMEERQRLARELHDSVSQQLFALTMLSEAAIQQIDQDPSTAKKQLEEIANAGLIAQSEMRALLLHLRPVYLSGDSLIEGVYKLITELKEKTQMKFHVTIDEHLSLSASKEEHVFRIIQEALSNILRHASATEVKLEIISREHDIFIYIGDNGKGFNIDQKSDQKTSYGLKNMKERSEELGGTFVVRSDQGKGTYLNIRIPCS